jgi:hypothetical protein
MPLLLNKHKVLLVNLLTELVTVEGLESLLVSMIQLAPSQPRDNLEHLLVRPFNGDNLVGFDYGFQNRRTMVR